MPKMTPSQKGAVAEAHIAAAAIELGLTVLRPLCEGRRYDLVLDIESLLLRVQCKLARRERGVLVVGLQTNRCTPRGYLSTSYTPAEIDAIAAFSPELGRSFLVPIEEVPGRRAIHLRLDPPRNGQSKGVVWAKDYRFAPMIERLRRRSDRSASPIDPATLSEPVLGL
jgi:hypothetical protein